MTDYGASVSLVRTNSPVELSSTCIPLMESDVIVLGDGGGSATVLLPSRAYVISQQGSYHVRAQELQIREEGRDTAVNPALGTRGSSLLNTEPEPIVMSPVDLFASVRPSLLRAAGRIDVLSPFGSTLSQTPQLVWSGNQSHQFRVQVVDSREDSGTAVYPVVDLKGCVLAWTDTGWPPLERGASYRIKIWQDDLLLTDETHVFRVAEGQQAEPLAARVRSIEHNLPAGVGRDLATASLLANPEHGCFAEARLIAARLLRQEPNNPVYLHLMKRCYAGMGMVQGVDAVERRLSGLE